MTYGDFKEKLGEMSEQIVLKGRDHEKQYRVDVFCASRLGKLSEEIGAKLAAKDASGCGYYKDIFAIFGQTPVRIATLTCQEWSIKPSKMQAVFVDDDGLADLEFPEAICELHVRNLEKRRQNMLEKIEETKRKLKALEAEAKEIDDEMRSVRGIFKS